MGSIPKSGRSPGGWHHNSLHYSCLQNPMDRGAWQATVHRVAQTEVTYRNMLYHMVLVILLLTHFISLIISRSIHTSTNSIISFF